MKIRNKPILKVLILLVTVSFFIVLGLSLYNNYYYKDTYYIIKPLPCDVPIKIRVDRYGDGHFGAPRHGYKHRGIDILADIGTPVLACKSGRVLKVAYDELSGNYVMIKHKDKLTSLYLHLKDVYVKEGMRLRQGEVIGTVGKTGNARYEGIKPHLHFEVRKDGVAQNILKVYELKSLTDDKN